MHNKGEYGKEEQWGRGTRAGVRIKIANAPDRVCEKTFSGSN